MNFCTECGSEMKANAKFCTNCGSKVKVTAGSPLKENKIPETEPVHVRPGDKVSSQQAGTIVIDSAAVQEQVFSYLYFLKDTLIAPSSVFLKGTWLNGLISLILFVLIQTVLIPLPFLSSFFQNVITQAAFVGILFVINKYLLGGTDSYLDALKKYGGMVNTQIILLLLVLIIGVQRPMGLFFLFVTILNQINLFNIYIFSSQKKQSSKIDSYYILLFSYVALAAILYVMFRHFL